MDEEMITLRNIMPVELAIKRELEYRKKIELLRNKHQSDLKPLMVSQGPPPTQAGIEENEMAACDSERSSMLQFSSSCQTFQKQLAFSCKACQLAFATVFDLSGHYVSREHKSNVFRMKKRKEAISNPIWCELCRSSCSSLNELERHLKGSRHGTLVLEFENADQANIQDLATNCKGKVPISQRQTKTDRSCEQSPGLVCVVCRTAFATVFHLKLHGETPTHRSRVIHMKRRGEFVSNPFVCELCDAACSTGRVMEFHLAGLKHATSLQEFQDFKRARAQGTFATSQ